MAQLEKDDIQGLVFNAYPKNEHALYLMLEVVDPTRARAWLKQIAGALSTGEQQQYEATVNLALTARGLAALGLPDDVLRTFSREFWEGMAGEEHRSRVLGDIDDSSPAGWIWGGAVEPRQAPGEPKAQVTPRRPVHAMLMLFAGDDKSLKEAFAARRSEYEGALREVFVRDTNWLPNRLEHFGFADGIAQPAIHGTRRAGEKGLKAGEFILGYANEYDKLPVSPLVPAGLDRGGHLPRLSADRDQRDLGRNGTYLVVRQLEQDVEGFWQAMQDYAKAPDGSTDRHQAIRIASKCVGRWPSGAPLVKCPDRDDAAHGKDDDFMYAAADRDGLKCPVGAHIRRANPRDSLEPSPDESLRVVDRHRIVRRGRSYGPSLEKFGTETKKAERGLFFICINANIRRQFEFIQQTWCNNGKFDGLSEDKDPLIGDQPKERGGTFTIPEAPVRRRLNGLTRFVCVRGGEYFFLPSVRAVRFLGELDR
jgi:Dyp-type peroxidase family